MFRTLPEPEAILQVVYVHACMYTFNDPSMSLYVHDMSPKLDTIDAETPTDATSKGWSLESATAPLRCEARAQARVASSCRPITRMRRETDLDKLVLAKRSPQISTASRTHG